MVDNSVPLGPATENLSPQQILNKRMVNAHVIKFIVGPRPLLAATISLLLSVCFYQSSKVLGELHLPLQVGTLRGNYIS